MVEIYYHPLNPKNPLFHSGGIRVSLDEFLAKDELWENRKERTTIGLDLNNPLYSKRIVDFMSQAILNISGHQTSESDIVKIKSFLEKIKHGVRHDERDILDKMTAPQFILGSLPYMFVGFNMDRRTKISHDGQNSLDSIYEVCKILCRKEDIDLSTLLCAHKSRRDVEKHTLIDRIKFDDVQKVLNVVEGIVDNSPVGSGKYVFYQPGGNIRDIQSVFPPLLYKYLTKGRVDEMLTKLEEHLTSMKKYLSEYRTHKLFFSAEDLGIIYQEAESQLSRNSKEDGIFPIKEISEKLTEGRIRGLLKQVDGGEPLFPRKSYSDCSTTIKQIEEIVLIENNSEKISKKALNETAVYYAWGILTGKNGGIGIGFEIDHDKYQTLAWHEGWLKGSDRISDGTAIDSPLIYARKNRKAEGSKYLKGLSLRESWR